MPMAFSEGSVLPVGARGEQWRLLQRATRDFTGERRRKLVSERPQEQRKVYPLLARISLRRQRLSSGVA